MSMPPSARRGHYALTLYDVRLSVAYMWPKSSSTAFLIALCLCQSWFTDERVQQVAFETPPDVERILHRQPRCGTAAQCMRSCHQVHV